MTAPSPRDLHEQAGGDHDRYIALMIEHGYLIEGKREPLPCGWPGRRVDLSEIREFRGRWAFLSNFHPSPLLWKGLRYPTAEHAFNAGKTLDEAARRDISRAPTPREAKRRGRSRSLMLRADWDGRVRFEVMTAVLNAKFRAHPGRIEALLSTGDALLVEGNRHHDQTWGTCCCGRSGCAEPGQNYLGILLMGLRADLAIEATCSCGGRRWVDDEGWQPQEWAMAVQSRREPGRRLIPCGNCNHGGWNVPVGGQP